MYFVVSLNDFIAFLPEFYFLFSLISLVFYCTIYGNSFLLNYPSLIANTVYFSLLIVFMLFFLVVNNFCDAVIFNKLLIVDSFGKLMKIFLLFCLFYILFFLILYSKNEKIMHFEFILFFLFVIFGIFLLISSYDLITVYLAIELQSFSSYVLSAFKRNSEFSLEASLKYFVLGAFSSGFLLFGFSLVYGSLGTTNYEQLGLLLLSPFLLDFKLNILLIGLVLIIVSFCFKLSAAPFHFWTPDVYEGAPLPVVCLFSVAPKIGLFVFLTRFFFISIYGCAFFLQEFFIIISFFSVFIGCLGALWQIKIKRLLSFSTINNVGLMLLGFSLYSIYGLFSLFFYCILYAFMCLCIFSILSLLYKNHDSKRLKYIQDFCIVSKQNYSLGFCLSISFFSIAGIPPFAGFFSKLFLFLSVVQHKLYLLAFICVLSSIISCFYYLRLIQISFFNQKLKWVSFKKMDNSISFLLSFLILFLLIFFIDTNLFVMLVQNILFELVSLS